MRKSLQNWLNLNPNRFDFRLKKFGLHPQFRVHELGNVVVGPITERGTLVHHINVWLPKRSISFKLVVKNEKGNEQHFRFVILISHVSKNVLIVLDKLLEFGTGLDSVDRENDCVRDENKSFVLSNRFLGRQSQQTTAEHSRVLNLIIKNCAIANQPLFKNAVFFALLLQLNCSGLVHKVLVFWQVFRQVVSHVLVIYCHSRTVK